MSVKIIDYKHRITDAGKAFFALTLQGGIEVVQSTTGKQYITIRKASLPTTFDEPTCQSLIGQDLPGTIYKVECESYEYTMPDTGDIIMLNHRYDYVHEEVQHTKQDFTKMYVPSVNGVYKEVA